MCIICGEIVGGVVFWQDYVVQEFQFSYVLVWEVFCQLEVEGLVFILFCCGVWVMQVDWVVVKENVEMWGLLEILVLCYSICKFGFEYIVCLEVVQEVCVQVVLLIEWDVVNNLFYDIFFSECGMLCLLVVLK